MSQYGPTQRKVSSERPIAFCFRDFDKIFSHSLYLNPSLGFRRTVNARCVVGVLQLQIITVVSHRHNGLAISKRK
ncbi:hypothetical protein ASPVEDRAFT_40533 [Aspergillus versicolor CBS 583.65]|uniref:Uncharacterized protein n=1 Tax=Aspergillus versicolor CBS 583.65 TaxID=1036611 RepID=A0A1L9PHL8_ASPVE|nr:uncharacterized protein ASPVEDRAFT_40533 [Aspergillus versicolor CBS 583.65]OJJ01009.1 hypothetical protein ASPVEDRAFT_40533 [Aspergillus versicolor CBS 583.65]